MNGLQEHRQVGRLLGESRYTAGEFGERAVEEELFSGLIDELFELRDDFMLAAELFEDVGVARPHLVAGKIVSPAEDAAESPPGWRDEAGDRILLAAHLLQCRRGVFRRQLLAPADRRGLR